MLKSIMPVGESWQRGRSEISPALTQLNCLLELGQEGSYFSLWRSAHDHILFLKFPVYHLFLGWL